MIEFQLDGASGVATYLQLVQQVRQGLQLGLLAPGDQLPTAQQVVAKLAINPNTVLKAYRDLEREGLVRPARSGDIRHRHAAPHRPIDSGTVPGVDEQMARFGACSRAFARRHRSDLSHGVPQPFLRGSRMNVLSANRHECRRRNHRAHETLRA